MNQIDCIIEKWHSGITGWYRYERDRYNKVNYACFSFFVAIIVKKMINLANKIVENDKIVKMHKYSICDLCTR